MTRSALVRVLALVVAALGVYIVVSAPPRTIPLTPGPELEEPVRGAVHVHSSLSDGTGTFDQIAEAAARAGLRFVVVTDHGDGTREPQPPSYRSGVLCIDAIEVTTTGGHLLALGLWRASPYPLGGHPADVVEDVARLGGMSVAAHPDSPRVSLRWADWETPVDGVEWLNADSEWRDESVGTLARALLTYPWRKPETLAALFDYPAETMRAWDALSDGRRTVGFAAPDAHASLGVEADRVGSGSRSWLAAPGYEQMFRTFSIALPALRLTGDAATDARRVIEEIRSGHVYSSIDALAAPARLSFSATSGGNTAVAGDALAVDGPVTLRVRVSAPDARIDLLSRGRVVASGEGAALDHAAGPERAAYRVEVRLAGTSARASVPWLTSNPIYVGGVEPRVATPPVPVETRSVYGDDGPFAGQWGYEKNDASHAAFETVRTPTGGTRLELDFALDGAADQNPWVAAIVQTGPEVRHYDGVIVSVRAERPMRVWVHARTADASIRRRWERSLYIDETERQYVLPFDELRSLDGAPVAASPADVQHLMFVIDQVHTPLGTRGRVWIDEVRFAR